MPTPEDDLKAKFWDDVEWFNKGTFPSGAAADPVYDRFHLDVRMKKIDDVDWHEGRGQLKAYFQITGRDDQARFDPDRLPGTQNHPTFVVMPNDPMGFVSGTADFVYSATKRDLRKRRRIGYSFAYKLDGGVWKAIYLWGQYID